MLWDEVYVKAMMRYHGGSLFGKAVDHLDKLAKTVLSIMVKCLYGGPEFIHKALPVSNLTGDFLLKEATPLLNAINESGAKVVAMISDGHRTNQNCFKQLNTVPGNLISLLIFYYFLPNVALYL